MYFSSAHGMFSVFSRANEMYNVFFLRCVWDVFFFALRMGCTVCSSGAHRMYSVF